MFNFVLLSLIVGLLGAAYLFRSRHKKKLPPSSVGFPVIGHLHLLKEPVHRCLHDLSRNLGPVYSLWLGSRRAVIVTSASAAEEFLTHQNNVVFANRPMSTYCGEENDEGDEAREVRELIRETFEFAGFTYVKRCKKLGSKLDKFFQNLVDEHRRNRGKTELEKTMITHLLCLQESEPEYYTDDIIKGFVLVMLLAGTDTTAVTLEWAMANLLNHPEVLMTLTTELNDVVSIEGRLMEEFDVHISIMLSPTRSDCVVAGYDIPRGSWLFINAWVIQRDPKVWDEPESFKPERFEYETHHGKFLPFGMGRRACPGMVLAQNDDVAVDMSVGRGLTMPKALALVAKCKSCPILDKLLF
ncbi:hypothetical protein AALP_AA8G510300 [Arabis alpina]|uniref:Cytochrome p450 n=1 Tax=Arabis alpina TaxID=50452 RepID=A0A087GEV1_ARAAL|nr:hypothetical protein AALP_AA8G510300 [Arabis alpina]